MPPKTDSVDSNAGETTSLDEPSVGFTAEHSRSYLTRQQRLSEAWGCIRGKLCFAVIESSVPYDKCNCFFCVAKQPIFYGSSVAHKHFTANDVLRLSIQRVTYFTVKVSGR